MSAARLKHFGWGREGEGLNPQSTPKRQNHKAIEQPERYRRQHEEIDCRDAIDMIGQKGPPALRWRPTPVHIACDRRLRERETELEQFTVNVWSAPEVICTAHRADEIAQLGRDPRPTNRLARPPAPVRLEPRAMPTDDCLRPENSNRAENGREPAIKPNEQQAIGIAELWSLRYLPAKHVELLAKDQDFCHQ